MIRQTAMLRKTLFSRADIAVMMIQYARVIAGIIGIHGCLQTTGIVQGEKSKIQMGITRNEQAIVISHAARL